MFTRWVVASNHGTDKAHEGRFERALEAPFFIDQTRLLTHNHPDR